MRVIIENAKPKEPKEFRIGDLFIDKATNDVYLIALINYHRECSLVSLDDGNRYTDPMKLSELSEFIRKAKCFEHVPNAFITVKVGKEDE